MDASYSIRFSHPVDDKPQEFRLVCNLEKAIELHKDLYNNIDGYLGTIELLAFGSDGGDAHSIVLRKFQWRTD